jgi:hypothetical protein
MSTDRTTKKALRIGVPVVLAAAAITGIGTAIAATSGPAQPGDTAHSGDPASYTDRTRTASGGLSDQRAASSVLAGFVPSQAVTAITAAPGLQGRESFTIALGRNDGGLADIWRADLAMGAYAELNHSADQVAFSDYSSGGVATGPNAKGAVTSVDLGAGAARFGQSFASPSDAALTKQIRDGAAKFGLTVKDLAVLHPLESAAAVTLVVPDGAVSWTLDDLRTGLFGTTPDVEGSLIQLVDSSGNPLLTATAAYRTAEGGVWFAPGQDARFGAIHGGAPWDAN